MEKIKNSFTVIVLLLFVVSCGGGNKKSGGTASGDHQQRAQSDTEMESVPSEQVEAIAFTEPELQFPIQEPIRGRQGDLEIKLFEESHGSFNEPMTFVFEEDRGMFRGTKYILKKIFLGD